MSVAFFDRFGKNGSLATSIRGTKIVDFHSGDRSFGREKLSRRFNRDNFGTDGQAGLVYSVRDLFARVQSAHDIYLSSKQSPTIWNMYSAAAVRFSLRARSYLTFVASRICERRMCYILRNMINNTNRAPPRSLARPFICRDADLSHSIMRLFQISLNKCYCKELLRARVNISVCCRQRGREKLRDPTIRLFVRYSTPLIR